MPWTQKGFTPLFFALKSKVTDAADNLIQAGADIRAHLPDGTTIIEAALVEKDVPVALEIVSRGLDMDHRYKDGRLLIHVAADNGNAELVKLVLSKGGDPNAMTTPPPVPPKPKKAPGAEVAEAEAQVPVAAAPVAIGGAPKPKLARADGSAPPPPPPPVPTPPLVLAAKAGSADAMKVLVDAGAKPDLKAADGLNITLAAAYSGNLDAVKYAVSLQPDLTVKSEGGNSVLHMAVANRNAPQPQEVIQFLVDKGADSVAKNDRGGTPGDAINSSGPESTRVFYIQLLKDRHLNTSTAH